MSMRNECRYLALFGTLLACLPALADRVDESVVYEAVERHLSPDVPRMQWVQDAQRVDTDQGDRIELRETVADELETIKLANLVAPIHFESGVAQIPAETVSSLQSVLARMENRRNVRLHLIGHADNQPLSPRLEQVFGDNQGLSRERAGQVAEYLQTALTLPPDAITYEWAGDTQPVASNLTAAGRALNRRVEVEVWYDEVRAKAALEEFLVPQEIKRVKVCRMETVCKLRYVEGHSRRARIQNLVEPVYYDEETIDVGDAFIERVRQGYGDLGDKQNLVVKFVGYADEAPLTGRAERIYGSKEGLSTAIARRVALVVKDAMDLPTSAIDSDGK
ncbi:MAG TPA: OmpA family protein, partial [Woeseiaceae bacterium]|nr:OmpA family protein [Woeseiaceae bacterium]